MSTLSDLLRRSSILHDFKAEADRDEVELGKAYVTCECGENFEAAEMSDAHTAWHAHVIAAQVAVVADWLDGLADEHNAKIALIAGVEFQPRRRDTSTAHGMRRAAAEARKGAGQ